MNWRGRQWAGRIVLTLGGVALLLAMTWWTLSYVTRRARAEWKDGALLRLKAMSITNDVVLRELKDLKAPARGEGDSKWAHDHVLLMANGEYVIYEYRHGRNEKFPPHLFLARSSEGRWLYSSYHFCNSMAMVAYDEIPDSLEEFKKSYSAREWDGDSAECLNMTQ